jgi:peptide/nickel transport system substrate-binding protein
VKQYLSCLAAGSLLLSLSAGDLAWAQKRGGILRLASPASPANMSIHESATIVAEMPMMGVFNNLVVFDQHKPQVSLDTIVTDLATSWSWNKDDTALTFQLRQDAWHDGKPFTAADVKCTWDLLLDKRPDKLRLNPRKTGYENYNRRNDERCLRGHLRTEAAAARLPDAACRRIRTDLGRNLVTGAL